MVKLAFTGGAELARQLRKLSEAMSKKIVVDALKAGAGPMRTRMASNAPRGDEAPHIADHMVISLTNKIGSVGGGKWEKRDEDELAVAVGPSKGFAYAIPLEWGTVDTAAQPFARPAFDSEAEGALRIIGNALWDGIARENGKGTL